MQESPEPPPSQQLSDETLRKAAETASEPSGPAWPTPEARHTLEPRRRAARKAAALPRVPCEAPLLPAATHAREPWRAQPQRAPINQGWGAGGGVQPEESDGFDPRIVLYVTVRWLGGRGVRVRVRVRV